MRYSDHDWRTMEAEEFRKDDLRLAQHQARAKCRDTSNNEVDHGVAPMLTPSQIKWASQHDWFVEAYDGFIACWDVSTHRGQTSRTIVYHHDFAKLRDWAGY